MNKRILSKLLTICMCASLALSTEAYEKGEVGKGNKVSIGTRNAFVIKTDNTLWTWGDNSDGILGLGNVVTQYTPVKLMDNVASIDAGTFHSAAIKTDGSLWMWGPNEHGQLGDGTIKDRYTPVKVIDDVAAVSISWHHSLALKTDGSVWSWGINDKGQVGDGTTIERHEPVKIMDNAKAVIAGKYASSFVIKEDNSLWAWGANYAHQLCDGTAIERHSPVKIMDDVKTVSSTFETTYVLKNDGSLYACGNNSSGQLGDGTDQSSEYPKKVMDNVINVSAGNEFAVAIKNDGSLWGWGANNCGQIGIGNTENQYTPVKIMENVVAVSAAMDNTLAVKNDGSLWSWGGNEFGTIGDGTKLDHYTPIKIIENVALPGPTEENIYDEPDPGEDVVLPTAELNQVTDVSTAINAVKALTNGMTTEQKLAPTGIDLATLYADTAIAKAASKTFAGNDILINAAAVCDLEAVAKSTATAVESALVSGGVSTARYLFNTVTLTTSETGKISIRIDPDILTTEVDKIRVETPKYALIFKVEDLKEDLTGILTFSSQTVTGSFSTLAAETVRGTGITASKIESEYIASNASSYAVEVELPGKLTNAITVSLPSYGADKDKVGLTRVSGENCVSKYNPATLDVEGTISTSGTLLLATRDLSKVKFDDITNKSKEMQDAITYLASNGIIVGKTEKKFAPDDSISRAEIAALLVRALYGEQSGGVCSFVDVSRKNWYYDVAASSQRHKLINGLPGNKFCGDNEIIKEQIVAVCGRILQQKMKYNQKSQAYMAKQLSRYKDNVAEWAKLEVAVATDANIVVYRKDGRFLGDRAMTRGDAAIIINRLLKKIW